MAIFTAIAKPLPYCSLSHLTIKAHEQYVRDQSVLRGQLSAEEAVPERPPFMTRVGPDRSASTRPYL